MLFPVFAGMFSIIDFNWSPGDLAILASYCQFAVSVFFDEKGAVSAMTP